MESTPPDVAVLDLYMPVMDGLVTIARMRAGNDLQKVPVVMLVGSELTPQETEGLRTGLREGVPSTGVPARPLLEVVRDALSEAAVSREGTDVRDAVGAG